MMGQNGKAAIKAVKLVVDEDMSPQDAWKKAICELTDSQSSQDEVCPRCTFLGLCEEGMIKRIDKGSYTKSVENKRYAIDAVNILRANPELVGDKNALWAKVSSKSHNGQMDVVISLWNSELIEVAGSVGRPHSRRVI